MKIAIISKADAFGGGASKVAEDLRGLLEGRGHVAHHYASWSGKGYDQNRRPLYGKLDKYIRKAHYLMKKIGFPEVIPFELPLLLRRHKENNYDLFHFHDLSSAISPITLLALSHYAPVVWTLHDCSSFTAGCLYPMGCEKYKTGCKSCPQIGEWPIDMKIDTTPIIYRLKKKVHSKNALTLVTPSQWMADTAFGSGIVPKKPHVISNGVDVGVYKAIDKSEARKKIGTIPLDRFVVLLSAGNILDERKGTRYALEALKTVKYLNPFIILVGVVDDEARAYLDGFDYYEAGYIADYEDLNLHYSSADLFLFCSLADNQPLVVLETMASGTPIIGFETGGIPEMVEQNKTGFLVSQKDIGALSNALEMSIKSKSYVGWGKNARKKAVEKYSVSVFLSAHEKYYKEIKEARLRGSNDAI